MAIPIDFTKLDARDVLDIAVFSELETRDRYDEFAAALEQQESHDAAKFFRGMARVEIRHADLLRERRTAVFGDAPQRYRNNVFWGIEAPGYESEPASLTSRQALEIALQAEVRAHDFYQGALDSVNEPRVADLLEELRRSELDHQRFIQVELDKLSR